MPRLDGTGPQGKGPQTGRGLGNCSQSSDNIQQKKDIFDISKKNYYQGGRGLGFGRRGLGFGRGGIRNEN